MSENKQRNIGAVLVTVGIICAAILTLLDYKIKNDLINAAMNLERALREYRAETEPDIVNNSDDSVRGDIPAHTENHHNAVVETPGDSKTVPESAEVTNHGKGRNPSRRIPADGE